MPEVFNVPDLFLWYPKCFDSTKRIIQVSNPNIYPISLRPVIFQKMLRFLEPNKELKLLEGDSFIETNGGLKKLLTYFIDASMGLN